MNKKVSKIGMLTLGISTSFVLGLGSVKAIGIGEGPVSGYLGYNQSGIKLALNEEVYTMTLEKNVNHDIVIESGENVILDLNGFDLINFTEACATIHIKEGGNLTIKGTGNVNQKASSLASVIVNEGTLTIENGSYKAVGDKMHAIYNSGTLTINDGTFETGATDVFGVANAGTASIKGGTFIQNYNYSVINNTNKMDITAGTFKISENNTDAYSLITNQKDGGGAVLNITGGSFTGNKGILYNDENDKVTIEGGTFKAEDTKDLNDYLAEDKMLNEDGTIATKKAADYTKLEEALKEAEALNKSDYTEESYKKLEEAVKAVVKGLYEDKQTEVDKMTEDIHKAIEGLQKAEVKKEDVVPNTADDYATNAVFGFVSLLGIGALSLVIRKRR